MIQVSQDVHDYIWLRFSNISTQSFLRSSTQDIHDYIGSSLQQNMHKVHSAFWRPFDVLCSVHVYDLLGSLATIYITTSADPHAGCLTTLDHDMDRTSYRSAEYILHAQNKPATRSGNHVCCCCVSHFGSRAWQDEAFTDYIDATKRSNCSKDWSHDADLLNPQLG